MAAILGGGVLVKIEQRLEQLLEFLHLERRNFSVEIKSDDGAGLGIAALASWPAMLILQANAGDCDAIAT